MLSNRLVRKSMTAFISGVALWSVFFAATTGPVLAGLLIALKMNNVEIGIINSLALLMLPCQMLGAWVQQHSWERKKFWFVTGLAYYGSYILLLVLLYMWGMLNHHLAVYTFIIIFAIGLFFVNLGVPVWFSWVGDLVPPRESNRFWNRRSGISQLSLVISSVLVGLFIDMLGKGSIKTYIWTIGGGTVFGMLSMFVSMGAQQVKPRHKPKAVSLLSKLRLVWRNMHFRHLVYFFGLQSFAQWLIIPFTFVYLQRTLNLSMSMIQLLVAACGITSFFSTYVFQIIGSKYGRKPIVITCSLGKGIEFICWALLLPGSPWFIVIIPFIIGGVVNIGLLTSTFSLITSTGRQSLRTLSVAMFFSLTGLLGFAASSLSGVIYDSLAILPYIEKSIITPFNVIATIGSVLLFGSTLLFARFREEGASPTVKVVKTLFANNPFRAIYHTHLLSNPMQEKSRIQALGKAQGNLMVTELVTDLYSPSNRIRESAVWNIGRKGKKADVILADELLKVLSMPALGIQAQAARALGHIQYHKATKYLVKYLDSRDATLTQSCIFALGLIGDNVAIAELENILRHDRFRVFWPHAAEAIGRVGNFQYTRKLYKAFSAEFNTVLKKQILIALLRTITDKKDQIYPIFEQGDKNIGPVTENIIKSIRSKIRGKENNQAMKGCFAQALIYEDHNNYVASLEQILMVVLNKEPRIFGSKNWNQKNIAGRLNAFFAANLVIRRKNLMKNNLKSVQYWLLIKLWAELKYCPSDADRYIYLSALQISKLILHAIPVRTK